MVVRAKVVVAEMGKKGDRLESSLGGEDIWT